MTLWLRAEDPVPEVPVTVRVYVPRGVPGLLGAILALWHAANARITNNAAADGIMTAFHEPTPG